MTPTLGRIGFGAYQLDLNEPRLCKHGAAVAIQPRPLAVLAYLAARPGEVVGREELLGALWAGTHVTRAVLKVAVRAMREALEDSADAPRFVETVGREGYRFIGAGVLPAAVRPRPPVSGSAMVGRGDDLAALRRGMAEALEGGRRVVFVTGEAGIGKTTLIDGFAHEVAGAGGVRVARGQCLEQYGEGEAYLPVLEALGSLVRADADGSLAALLRRYAPTWAAQLTAVAAADTPRDAVLTTAPARMLRELVDAFEVLARRHPIVLVLEDLHWSDPSTVDLIGAIARRRQLIRLMVIASFRPADVIVPEHPLHDAEQELHARGECVTLRMAALCAADVAAYLDLRFGIAAADDVQRLAARIHERTDGNALFMVNVVNDLVARGLLAERDGAWHLAGSVAQATDRIPAGLREFIDRRLQRLAPETRRSLEVASVAGEEFTVAAVAAGLGAGAEPIEDLCETLAAQGLLIAETGIAEWPDGTISGRYRFLHGLYRQALYESIGASRRIRLHRAIGLREEAGFGAQAGERAAQLAMHFTRGHDPARAVEYHARAGAAARDRHAAHEAVGHFSAALEALAQTPAGADRGERERGLVVARATLLMAIRGYAAPETERAYAHAEALCDAAPASPAIFPVLRGLLSYHQVRAQLADAHQLGATLLHHAACHPGDAPLRVQANYGHGATLFHMGALEPAQRHLEAALQDYDPATHALHARVYGGYDPGVACSLWLAWTLALAGRLDEATAHDRAGLARARALGDAFSLAWACQATAVSQQAFGDWAAAEEASAEAMALAEEHGFPHVLGMAAVGRGWALVMQGKAQVGVPILRRGVAAVEATGAALVRPSYLGMLAVVDALEGDGGTAARRFDEALAEVERTGERVHEATLLIARSQVLAADAGSGEESLRRARDLARRQTARLVELRAAVALAQHCRATDRAAEARDLLAASHMPFVEIRRIAPEIAAARQLLAELEG